MKIHLIISSILCLCAVACKKSPDHPNPKIAAAVSSEALVTAAEASLSMMQPAQLLTIMKADAVVRDFVLKAKSAAIRDPSGPDDPRIAASFRSLEPAARSFFAKYRTVLSRADGESIFRSAFKLAPPPKPVPGPGGGCLEQLALDQQNCDDDMLVGFAFCIPLSGWSGPGLLGCWGASLGKTMLCWKQSKRRYEACLKPRIERFIPTPGRKCKTCVLPDPEKPIPLRNPNLIIQKTKP